MHILTNNDYMKIIKGDLIKHAQGGNFNIIAHGCNCHNTMGSGIARQIREQYPAAYEVDCTTVKGDYNKLGNYTVMLGKQFNIVNAYTQYYFNTNGSTDDVFEYAAFELILKKLVRQYPGCRFGFPFIGSGLACGNKERILTLLDCFAQNVKKHHGTVTLVEFA